MFPFPEDVAAGPDVPATPALGGGQDGGITAVGGGQEVGRGGGRRSERRRLARLVVGDERTGTRVYLNDGRGAVYGIALGDLNGDVLQREVTRAG